jgi:hypothetical protein
MVLDADLSHELNLIAHSENMPVRDVVHIVLGTFSEDYWKELKKNREPLAFKENANE